MINNKSSIQNIIDAESLTALHSAQGKVLEKVICYLWVNQINPEQPIDIIDTIEFIFTDQYRLAITGNEAQEGLAVVQYDFDEQKKWIDQTFNGKVKIFKIDASKTSMWQGVISQMLIKVKLTKDKNTNQYYSDEAVLEFENKEMRVLKVHPLDGIILDYYEEI